MEASNKYFWDWGLGPITNINPQSQVLYIFIILKLINEIKNQRS
jgi:hypothetical protein